MFSSHIRSYLKKNGIFVRSHERKHPQKGDKGERVVIHHPSKPTPFDNWHDPRKPVTVVPDGPVPGSLNGVDFAPWVPDGDWENVDGQADIDEPIFKIPNGKKASTGVVIREDDGRVWLIAPTNAFGGYKATFPKGRVEDDLPLQAVAIKEAFEESGLKVEITGFLADVPRTTTMTRYYSAKRVGGTPDAMGWESQGVHLIPVDMLSEYAGHPNDAKLISLIER